MMPRRCPSPASIERLSHWGGLCGSHVAGAHWWVRGEVTQAFQHLCLGSGTDGVAVGEAPRSISHRSTSHRSCICLASRAPHSSPSRMCTIPPATPLCTGGWPLDLIMGVPGLTRGLPGRRGSMPSASGSRRIARGIQLFSRASMTSRGSRCHRSLGEGRRGRDRGRKATLAGQPSRPRGENVARRPTW